MTKIPNVYVSTPFVRDVHHRIVMDSLDGRNTRCEVYRSEYVGSAKAPLPRNDCPEPSMSLWKRLRRLRRREYRQNIVV
ncbi:uncharacterized protein LACBIDRAFT_312875 [Laccaria bicolor S238N-H82]|uniref:Predicted protein n=1 Tax=Laccaria bicolor (strain S238N-H82 / ATCC MYA-4686) TaxID=486041 RepID=B0DX08_LACBS|nr:uncharacterized protein LACBIDRAFT_312875 [Laccaria bicolor S238N-H82]EDR00906.1 predicted protein [Laccaria bicolor S238N-H82]|eukprot:XP_001888500.1 predicted protein [Laccaria bicolor S238N-H82]